MNLYTKSTLIQGNMTTLQANVSTSNDNYDTLKRYAMALLVIDPVVAVMTVVGNGVFIITLVKKRSLHTPSNILLGALAFSDLFVGIIAQPLFICELSLTVLGRNQSIWYTISYFTIWAFVFFSFLYINVVSLDRYIAVCFPTWYYSKATCKSHITIAVSILILSAIGYSIGQFIGHKANTYIPDYMFTAFLGISLLITGFCNFNIFKVIRRQQKEIREQIVAVNYVQSSHSGQDTYKSLIIPIITILLFICSTPMVIIEVLWGSVNDPKIPDNHHYYVLQLWTEFLILLNSFVNPVVYYARMRSFRDAAGAVVCPSRSQIATTM